jgi:hypothetical protein
MTIVAAIGCPAGPFGHYQRTFLVANRYPQAGVNRARYPQARNLKCQGMTDAYTLEG